MENINCLQCKFRHPDNGNCMKVGGFCTAVPAAYCPLLRQYLGTGLTPEQAANAKTIIESAFAEDTSKAERIRKLLAADKEDRCIILPCKVGDVLYAAESAPVIPLHVMEVAIYLALEGEDGGDYERISNIGKTVFLTREEAELALKKEKEKFNVDVSQT